MRPTLVILVILAAGCTTSGASDDLVIKLENASSNEETVTVNLDELGGKRIDRFQVSAKPQDSASRGVDLPDVETVLVSVEADGKVVGAKSISPAKCSQTAEPFRIEISQDGTVNILGKEC